jgi:hypothetical protein
MLVGELSAMLAMHVADDTEFANILGLTQATYFLPFVGYFSPRQGEK